ncbi:hypothetical protein [uncultured Aquimarina sp.]|uniref:hypothetical protein n=1 Tax=uncultured Aquimarina sp. TaxID=575652 RepID=UPI00261D44E0|nr:hypothetical protein [uncultured Aquimarina sp.]
MNKFLKLKSILIVFTLGLLFTGCSADDNTDLIITDPNAEFDADLLVTEAGTGDRRNVTVNASDVSGSTFKAKVAFSANSANMRRLYITQNISAFGEEPFVFTSQEVDEKPDGSLDLVGDDKDTFEFQLDLPKPTMTDGTVVYKLWATTGRGDFRDVNKRNALGDNVVGIITVRYGTGVNDGSGIKAFSQTILAAPLADGSSNTFISLYNNEVYKISEGEETAALWDFGYYYGATQNASLASTANYPTNIIDVPTISSLTTAELNNFYIAASTIDFDAVAVASDLDGITAPTSERVTGLSVNDVLEFADQYGNKGVIKITEISGTDGTGDFIRFDVKVQVQ